MSFLSKVVEYCDKHLVEDWRSLYKTWTAKLSGLVGGAALIWPTLTTDQQIAVLNMLHITQPSTLVLIGAVAIIIGRAKAQNLDK